MPTEYQKFVKDHFQDFEGSAPQRMKKIGKLWTADKKRRGVTTTKKKKKKTKKKKKKTKTKKKRKKRKTKRKR